jgi:hypothetical protein
MFLHSDSQKQKKDEEARAKAHADALAAKRKVSVRDIRAVFSQPNGNDSDDDFDA